MSEDALIEMVKQNEFLYDKDHKDNNNFKKREIKWAEIGTKLNITGQEAYTRWGVIRDRYVYFKQYENDPTKCGTKTGELRSYKYFEKLSFLDNYFFGRTMKISCPRPHSWRREHTTILLQELKNHPLLYDQEHPHYSNRAQRKGAFLKIIDKLKPYKLNLTPPLVANKLRVIRTQFSKEKRLMKASDTYEPKLWCYDMLVFMDKKRMYDVISPHPAMLTEAEVDTLDEVDEDVKPEIVIPDEINECFYNDSNDQIEEIKSERVYNQEQPQTVYQDETRNVIRSKCLQLLDFLTKETGIMISKKSNETSECSKQSPQTPLGLLVESELSKVSEEIYIDTKWKIMRVLEDAERKALRKKRLLMQPGLQTITVSPLVRKPY